MDPGKYDCWRWSLNCFSVEPSNCFYYCHHPVKAKEQSVHVCLAFSRLCVCHSLIKGLLHWVWIGIPAMATKIKGICKGFKFISQIFVVKDREMEIGYPTDVKHVAHIGWDGHSGIEPSWMNDFNSAPDFSTSIGNPRESNTVAISSWSSQDFDQAGRRQSDIFRDIPTTDIPNVPKKQKRKKKSTFSPKSSSSSSRSSRVTKSKSTLHELQPTRNLQV